MLSDFDFCIKDFYFKESSLLANLINHKYSLLSTN